MLDLQEQERKALDCLEVCAKFGLEGTANELAALLGLSQQWRQQKDQPERKVV
jgi:hypothetical protein